MINYDNYLILECKKSKPNTAIIKYLIEAKIDVTYRNSFRYDYIRTIWNNEFKCDYAINRHQL